MEVSSGVISGAPARASHVDEPPNKGMEQTNGAQAGMEAPFAAHPQCSTDLLRSDDDETHCHR